MNTANFPRLRSAYCLAALALALGLISCSVPAQGGDTAQSRAHTVTVQIGGSAASQRGVVYDDGAVASVSVNVTDSDSNPVGSISLKKTADHWGGSIELTGTGIYTFAATASSAGGGKMYTGTGSQNIPTDGLTVSIPVSAYTYAIGDTGPAGGLVFYDNTSYTGTPAWRYMEAATSDQSTSIQWYNGDDITISTGTAIGTGKANTAAIIAAQGSGYAASLCANLSLGGYSDWFLPSKDELNFMYTNSAAASLGGFSGSWYWSSSQYYDYTAWSQNFSDGDQNGSNSTVNHFSVRAVRAF